MNQNMIPGERLIPCPSCGQPTIVRDRVYTTDGYPYVHECPPAARKVPNEGDFCVCGTLTWNALCDDCKGLPVSKAVKKANAAIQPRIHPVRNESDGLPL